MKRLLLAGGGQAHVFVLRELARRRPKNVEVVLLTLSDQLIYSGMLPGWVAGHYQLPELTIPLIPLAAAAGVRVVTSRMVAVDLATKTTHTSSGAAIEFDLLSIATGSVLDFDAVPGTRDYALPLRPLENFVAGWQRIYMHVLSARDPIRLTIIGGGAGGTEIALAVMYRLRTVQDAVRVQLVTGDVPILPGHGERVRTLMREALLHCGVRLIAANAAQLEPDTVVLEDGCTLASDATMLITGEECDDGNGVDGDGCYVGCREERLDNFKCYRATTTGGTPKFERRTVHLTDQFESKDATVLKPATFCNPARVGFSGAISDLTAHLECYKIKDVGGQLPFAPRELYVMNAFRSPQRDPLVLQATRASLLCVPSEKDGVASELNLDHFKCYKANLGRTAGSFGPSSIVIDEFRGDSGLRSRRPKFFCNPVDKDGEGIRDPEARMLCYRTSGGWFERRGVSVENQFGEESLTLSKPGLLCVPSWEVVP